MNEYCVENIAYTYFYGDCQVMDCFIGWTEDNVAANVNDKGLLETGMTFGEGCTGLNTADGKLPKGYDDMHIAAVGANSSKASIPVLTSLKRTASTVTAPLTENEVATVQQKLFSWFPTYEVYLGDNYAGCVRKEFSFFTPRFTIDYMGWDVEGDWFEWDYSIYDPSGNCKAVISKELFRWTDTYSIDVRDPDDALAALALVIAIDAE